MENKMTVRLNDEEKKKLNDIAIAFTYNGVHSKAVRLAIDFTSQCIKKLKFEEHMPCYTAAEKLNKYFKTDVNNYRYF